MHEDLQRLARELREETCPRRVLDEAKRRIAAETPPHSRLRYAIPAALAALVLAGGLLVKWHLTTSNVGYQNELVTIEHPSSPQVARQAETALAMIGTVLRDAGARSETVISHRAIPPLRNGLQTAKNKIIRQTEL